MIRQHDGINDSIDTTARRHDNGTTVAQRHDATPRWQHDDERHDGTTARQRDDDGTATA